MRTKDRTWPFWLLSVLDSALLPWPLGASQPWSSAQARGLGSGPRCRETLPAAASLLGADSAGPVSAKGICLTPVALTVHSGHRDAHWAPGL